MTDELKNRLVYLADKYENHTFVESDPSQILYRYDDVLNTEVAAFIAAILSFGSRKVFIPKIINILDIADERGKIAEWIKSDFYREDFYSKDGSNDKKYYRFYSYNDLYNLFDTLKAILNKNKTFGFYMENEFKKTKEIDPCNKIMSVFSRTFVNCNIVPKGKNSANKRLHMFLRWMVRENSSVDLGLWNWYNSADLIIPLDVHVLKESEKLGLIKQGATASFKSAKIITNALKTVWPDDPCKGDFALFGLGVSNDER